jgi:hypothetical protein
MLDGLITIAGGILAASALIIARKPNAKQLIDKLTPYQGWIGFVMFFWGIWGTFSALKAVALVKAFPVLWTIWLVCGVADLAVGFLLGFGLVSKYALSKSPTALAKGQELRMKLAKYQGAFGLLAIATGATYMVLHVIY